jgi:methyl-accepting chemotaxis protein
MYIRTRISLIQSFVAVIALGILLALFTTTLMDLLTEKDELYYREKLNSALARVESENADLVRGGLADIPAYVEGSKGKLIESLRSQRFAHAPGEVYLFIVDDQGKVVLHPSLATGDPFASTEFGPMLASSQGGTLSVPIDGRKTWVLYEFFEPWKWYLGYAVREDFKYAAVGAFQRKVLLIGGLLIVMLVSAIYVSVRWSLSPLAQLTRITREIVRTGDLNQKVEFGTRDEVGTLAETFQQMVEKMRVVPLTIQELSGVVANLTQLIQDQTDSTQRQAAGLAEATVTMQEIRQTSNVAASKAEKVIGVAKTAEESAGSGQIAVENSIQGLQEIRDQIDQIVSKIADLSERTLQVGGIIETVKDLADQSNMLALNASIEAVKAGELGKGFGVVAREIRSLADQSIQATGRIREELTGIQNAIRSAVSMTERGKADMERSMEQIRSSGESLKEMGAVMTESSQAARQIASSVNQQNMGISQIAGAIEGLNAAMETTTTGIRHAEQAAASLSSLSVRLSETFSGSTG